MQDILSGDLQSKMRISSEHKVQQQIHMTFFSFAGNHRIWKLHWENRQVVD